MKRKNVKMASILLAVALLLMQGTGLIVSAEEIQEVDLPVDMEEMQGIELSVGAKEIQGMESVTDAEKMQVTESTSGAEEGDGNETAPESDAGELENNEESGINPISGIEDITPPKVTGIQLGSETVETPGTLEIKVEATDDVSGASHATIYFRNPDTEKELYTQLYASYYNVETGKETAYEDGKLHGKLEVSQYASAGTYIVENIYIYDKADNSECYYGMGSVSYNYYKEKEPEALLPETVEGLAFSVTNNGAADVTAPTAESIIIDQGTVEAPGQIQVTVEALDDMSGVRDGRIYFRNVDTDMLLSESLYLTNDGKLLGTLEVGQYITAGNYVIESLNLCDNVENSKTYYGLGYRDYDYMEEQNLESLLPESLKNVGFTVVNHGIADITEPIVVGFTLKKDYVEVPAVIEVLVEGEDDISGVAEGWIYFRNPETEKQLYAYVQNTYYDYETGQMKEYADGMLHGEIWINHYTGTGNYVVKEISIYDHAGNFETYWGAGTDNYENMKDQGADNLLPEAYANLSFYVYNDGKGFDVTATTQTPNLVEQIKYADEQAEILVDYSYDSVLKKEIFDVIKGTGKTISLVAGDGVQWIFQGSDIVNDSKDIDLRVSMEFITQSTGEAAEAIEELVEEKKTVILRFPENGVLPGKAKIRVKADYSMRQYLGEEGIYVYYFDNTANELVPIAANLVLTDDYYIEFEIEHCSYYIMTAGQVQKEEVPPEKPDDNAGQETEKPDNNAEQGENKPDNNKNDIMQGNGASSNGQESGRSVNISPKTGEDTSGEWHFWGGIILLAFLCLACQKAGINV